MFCFVFSEYVFVSFVLNGFQKKIGEPALKRFVTVRTRNIVATEGVKVALGNTLNCGHITFRYYKMPEARRCGG